MEITPHLICPPFRYPVTLGGELWPITLRGVQHRWEDSKMGKGKRQEKNNRREFLKRSLPTVVLVPAVTSSSSSLEGDFLETWHEADELLPGDYGYRDQGAYGNRVREDE